MKREEMNNNNNGGNGFMGGFLLGALIGGAVVFFLSSKKGKQLLKNISEEGIDRIANLAEVVSEEVEEKIEKKVVPIREKAEEMMEGLAELQNQDIVEKEVEQQVNGHNKKQPIHRRFFKGVSKKTS